MIEPWLVLSGCAFAAYWAVRVFDRHRRQAADALAHVEEVRHQAAIEKARLDVLECAVEEYIARRTVQEAKCRTKPHSS